MQPIGPLMIEHRLIERMFTLMQREWQRITDNMAVDPEFHFVDPVFIDTAVDFIRTYADRCHHGKEEDILFTALKKKDLAPEHRQMMEELTQEHVWGRETTAALVRAKEDFLLGQDGALEKLVENLGKLVDFYPRHIDKEDKHFFIPCMEYFSDAEKADMLQAMFEFDREMIHEKYRSVVEGIETRKSCHI
ncbi:MAG: hemerythrin domain-containing protein [Thermodesulfobacteriota bacterium]